MKRTAIIALILMTPAALLAASKNSGNVTFSETVTVNGTQVPPGNYRVEWQGTGTSVEASILRGGKVVATSPATIVTGKTDLDGALNRGMERTTHTFSMRSITRTFHCALIRETPALRARAQ